MQTKVEQFSDRINEFLRKAKGSTYDKAAVIYNIIEESADSKEAFIYFLENANDIDSSEEKEVDAYFTAQKLKKYETEYSELIDGLLNKTILRHYEKEKFYEEIWSAVMDSDLLFEEKDIKIFALGRIWADARIPYFCVKEGIKMSNEDFVNIISRNKKLLQEINFILSCKYDQRTQTSSLLIDVLSRVWDDEKERAVIMASILGSMEQRVLMKILNKVPVKM